MLARSRFADPMTEPLPPAPEPPRPFRSAVVLIAVAAGLHAAVLLHATPLQSANDRSRWSTVWALVERDTFAIDAIDADPAWTTIDKVQQDGRLYSTKPALLTVLGAGVYAAVKAATGWSLYGDTAAVTRAVLGVVNLLPFLASLAALAAIARKYARTGFARVFVLATGAFGTYVSAYSATFNNHTVAAVSLLFALFFALRIVADGSRRASDFALCGLTSAFVTANELPAAAFGLAMFALLFRYDARRTLLAFGPAAAVVVAAFVVTTWLQTGTWKPFYLSYGTEKYVYIRDGLPSYWAEPKGVDRNLDSPLVYLLHCTVGHHGLLSLSPVFLLTVATWLRLPARPAEPYRPLLWMGLGLTALILGFYLTRTSNYNYGGNTVALRWAIWLVPFWLLALIPTLDAFADRRLFRFVASALLAASTFSAWEAAANPWRPSWLFSLMESAGWIDYRDRPPALPRPLVTWFSALPPAGADPAAEWIELTAVTERGTETIRLALAGAAAAEDEGEAAEAAPARSRATVAIRLTTYETDAAGRREVGTVEATLDRARFAAGAGPEEFLLAGRPTKAAATRAILRFPSAPAYREGPIRYQKTPLRELAFRTQQVSAVADVRRRTGGTVRRRVEAWLCPDVPFGVVRLRETLTDAATGDWLGRRDYVLSAAGRMEEPEWAQAIRSRAGED